MAKKQSKTEQWDAFFKANKPAEPVTIDRSALEEFATCPFMAQAIRDGKVNNVNAMMDTGIECHKILQDAMEQCGGDTREVIGWLEAEAQTSRPDIQPQVLKALRGIKTTLCRIPAHKIIGLEQQYSAEFAPASGKQGAIVLTACIDMVIAGKDETEIHIHDYKTGWKQRSNTDAANAFQTCQYSWLIFKNYPDVNTIHFWYEQTRFGTRAYARITRGDFFNFAGRLQAAVSLYMAGADDAWPDIEKCGWCPATSLCPHVIAEAYELNADPAAWIGQLIALSKRVTAMKSAGNAYVKEHGNIVVGDIVYGWEPTSKRVNKVFKDIPESKQ